MVGSSSSSRFGWPGNGERDAHLPAAENVRCGARRPRPRSRATARSPFSARCCSRRRSGSGPADRRSAPDLRVPLRHHIVAQLRFEACISVLIASSSPKALAASSKTVRPQWLRPSCGKVADGERGRREDRAGVGLVEPGHHAEQGGLAGAVGFPEADAFAIGDCHVTWSAGRDRRATW